MPNNLPQKNDNGTSNLVDVLEKVLDKGVVIAGDIRVGIADVELLSIKIRLIVASVDKAKEIGLDWWETDPYLTSKASEHANEEKKNWEEENQKLQQQIQQLENKINASEAQTAKEPEKVEASKQSNDSKSTKQTSDKTKANTKTSEKTEDDK